MVDQDNPTVRSVSGFPMCIPRVLADPSIPGNPDDPLCPLSQRPAAIAPATGFAAFILTNDPVALPGVPPDATKQAPFEVGDYVTYAGTLVQDGASPRQGRGLESPAPIFPLTRWSTTWASTHGREPIPLIWRLTCAFIGTGGLTVIGDNEAAIMTRFEGFSTDPIRGRPPVRHRPDPATGATSDRDWGTIGVDPGPAKRRSYRPLALSPTLRS